VKHLDNGEVAMLLVVVDDTLIMSTNPATLEQVKMALSGEYKMTGFGRAEWLWGIRIRNDGDNTEKGKPVHVFNV
jgi:hypothetical protein